MVVNCHEQCLPAGALDGVLAVACDPVAGTNDAPQFLGVNVQQIAWGLVFIANYRLRWLQIARPG